MFRFPTKGDDKKKIMRFQHFLGTTLITKIWIEKYEDVVCFTDISNYCREDVGVSTTLFGWRGW